MTGEAMRAWCAVYQWPGRERFVLGTAFVRHTATLQEVEAELRAEFKRMWGRVLPESVPLPELRDMRPGSIIFHEESE